MLWLPELNDDEAALVEVKRIERFLNHPLMLEFAELQKQVKDDLSIANRNYWEAMLRENRAAIIEQIKAGDKSLLREGDWVRIPLSMPDGTPFTAQASVKWARADIRTVRVYWEDGSLDFGFDSVEWEDPQNVYPS